MRSSRSSVQSLKQTVAPQQQPVTLDDAKRHLRVDWPDDDAYIFDLINAAQDWLESRTSRALITQTLQGVWTLPKSPESQLLFVGGTPADAIAFTRLMERITLARNAAYGLPSLGFSGTPTGIDARRVIETGIAPVINTGIAHREAGIGQIGAGIARAPLACFEAAIRTLADGLGIRAGAAA